VMVVAANDGAWMFVAWLACVLVAARIAGELWQR